MQITKIIPVIGLSLIPLYAVLKTIDYFVQKKKLDKQLIKFNKKFSLHFLGALLCMPIVIGLNFYRSFDVLTTFAITATGVLGFIIAFNDMLFSSLNGLYKNALVWHGEIIYIEIIDSINRVDPSTLEIITKKRNRKLISDKNIVRLNEIEKTIKEFQS